MFYKGYANKLASLLVFPLIKRNLGLFRQVMHLKYHIYIILTLIILQGFNSAYSQKPKKKYSAKSVVTAKDTSTAKKSEFQINFKNLGLIPAYINHDQLKLIKKYEANKDYEKLLPVLEQYV